MTTGELIAAAVAGIIAILTPVGTAIAFLLNHLSKERAAQRAHDLAMVSQIAAISKALEVEAERYKEATEQVAVTIAESVKAVASDHRAEFRKMFDTLLSIQHDSTQVTAGVSQRLGELSAAVADLRRQMGGGRRAERGEPT